MELLELFWVIFPFAANTSNPHPPQHYIAPVPVAQHSHVMLCSAYQQILPDTCHKVLAYDSLQSFSVHGQAVRFGVLDHGCITNKVRPYPKCTECWEELTSCSYLL